MDIVKAVGLARGGIRFGTSMPGVRLPLGPPPEVDRSLAFAKITSAEPCAASKRCTGIRAAPWGGFLFDSSPHKA